MKSLCQKENCAIEVFLMVFHLSEFSPKLSSVKTQSWKSSIFSLYFKSLSTFSSFDLMRFCWDYFHHPSYCQWHDFLDLEEVVVLCQLVYLLCFGNLKYLKLLEVVWTLLCYLFQNPAFNLTLKIMILAIFFFSISIFQTCNFQQMHQLHLPYSSEYFFHWSGPLK